MSNQLEILSQSLADDSCPAYKHDQLLRDSVQYCIQSKIRLIVSATCDMNQKFDSEIRSVDSSHEIDTDIYPTVICYGRMIKHTDDDGEKILVHNGKYFCKDNIVYYFWHEKNLTKQQILNDKYACALKCTKYYGVGALVICKYIGNNNVVDTSDFQFFPFKFVYMIFKKYTALVDLFYNTRSTSDKAIIVTVGITKKTKRIVLHAVVIDIKNEIVARATSLHWITNKKEVELMTRQLILPM
jgi:hypothetical protein